MAALQYADQPGYSALILRRTYADLALPGAIMDRSHEWLQGSGAKWNETEKTWTFPSGATLTFGYLQYSKDKFRYQGAEFQFVAFDELTQFPEEDYRYLFSRLRRLQGSNIPIRMRSASNPGNIGHEWVYQRFVANPGDDRAFVPAKLEDNPHLDRAEYEKSLAELDPITRRQLLDGVWVRDTSLQPFKRKWWTRRNRFDSTNTKFWRDTVARFISWDTAFTDKDDSAYTACTVAELTSDYRLALREVWRAKLQFPDLVPAMKQLQERYSHDGKLRAVIIEDLASGVSAYQTLLASADEETASVLVPFQPKGTKTERGQQAAVWGSLDSILLPYPSEHVPWLAEFENELFTFPLSEHKDQVDALNQMVLYTEHLLSAGHHARENVGEEYA